MKNFKLVFALIAIMSIVSCTSKQDVLAPNQAEVKKGKGNSASVEATTTSMTLTNNGGGSFSIDYGGATNVVWMFFRWGDSLSTVSGNVIPVSSQSFYQNPVTTFTANGSGTFYQAVIITGSTAPDANGVVGADWVTNYSNVVQ